ncbi:TAF4 (YMR005W) [Zygosaccharomyces parabailii]|uniref:Transcription initiation factor TFIID subunit 4 n=1 Tax=Zygosaccharomyces bailii (strain CLIB 213 / ATCC 58445 / CBS 680 / BCRC 21525 / NBRC 1098 / NCYC 1416 / NRRL Y-2227) TaxID=1333698 RepID=A0A8J2X7V9_ZYGB2|nr:TAF4 (YMR005W) [Zygosaccharomyces parabailii]CDF89429.1 ZYBA0S04-04126g1_1 [Zygosaccharomyces bailii CLIB 213]CDH13555.1 related to Transcription initiation factor TFIID subunit 4 [Zygosaccharomyces bailii ISA1307]SJM85852.1 related to Transcription initiation factor TFIID subunit 4 [Zygosaccharomyces bailii]
MVSPKREAEETLESSINKRSKEGTPLEKTDPAFDIAGSDTPFDEEISTQGQEEIEGEFSKRADNEVEGLALPKNTPPSTDLQKSDSGLALPKKGERKKYKTSGKSGHGGNASSSQQKGKGSSHTGPQGGKNSQSDPNKMSDVLFSAGVDIREEEALLNSSVNASKSHQHAVDVKVPPHPPFLHPDQVNQFMRRVCKEQSFSQNFAKNPEILRMMSSACESYMRDIITNSLVISRHRRKAVKLNSGRRSEISVALRSIAISQKKEEERRVKKRVALGLEKEDLDNKMDSEETLHRASNVTAGLRAGSKKQYGWLTSSTSKPTSLGGLTSGKVASAVAARGDSGLRFREAREEPGIVMRDLLYALENRRNGVHNIVSKGYARIRD